MALTKLSEPDYIMPAYNPIVFSLSSTNAAQENFRYICYLYDCDNNLLTTITNPPDPGGRSYFNLQKICSSYVPITKPSKRYTYVYKSAEQACFTAKFAESYTEYFTCTSVQIAGTPVDGFDLQFYFNSGHQFNIGEIISFSGTGTIGTLYNNTWQIVATPSPNLVVVNGFNQGTANSATTASCVLASHQRTNQPIETGLDTEFWVGNSALDTCDFIDYKVATYEIGNTAEYPVKWFNNLPQPYTLRSTNYMDLNVYYPNSYYPTNSPSRMVISTINNAGVTSTYQTSSIPDTSWQDGSIFYVPCGPRNLNNANVQVLFTAAPPATFPIIKADTISYSVTIWNGLSQVTETMLFEIDTTCSKYTNFELNFLDRKGNYVPFNFTLVQRKNVGVNRTTFKQGLGKLESAAGWYYDCTDRGTTTLNNTINYTYTLQTNWLSEDMSLYFEELMTSPNVFWDYDGLGNFRPVVLTTNAVDVLDKKNSRLIQYSVTMTLANNPVVQLGA